MFIIARPTAVGWRAGPDRAMIGEQVGYFF